MPTGTILPEDEEGLSLLREQARHVLQMSDDTLKKVLQLMSDNPLAFSTSRVRRMTGLRTEGADEAHKFLLYLVHQNIVHEKSLDTIKKDLVKLGAKPEQVKVIADTIANLPNMSKNYLDVLFIEYARAPEEEVNEGTVSSFRGEMLLRTFAGDDGTDMIYPIAHVYLGLNKTSGQEVKLELMMNLDEYGKLVSLFEESYDDLLEEAKKTKKNLKTDLFIALER